MDRPTYQQLEEQLKVAQDKARAAELKRDAAQEHVQAAYRALQINNALPYLLKATLLFMMKDIPDPATIFSEQVEAKSRREARLRGTSYFRTYNFLDNHGCLGDIALLVELPKHGADLAIKKAIEGAAERVGTRHYGQKFESVLPNCDYVALAAVCRKASIAGVANPYDPRCHMDAFVEPMQRLLPRVNDLVLRERSKDLQAYPSTIGRGDAIRRGEAAEEPPTKREAKAVLKKIWFPLTLKLLHELLQKEIAEYVVPLIAGNTLPVELTDMICAFCYDGEFVAKAPAIAKQNAPKISSRG